MTLQLLQFRPGIVKDITEYSAGKNGPYWIDGENVRFRNGYPTKIGGWVKDEIYGLTAADEVNYSPGSEVTLIGVARNLNFWRSLSDGEDYMAIGLTITFSFLRTRLFLTLRHCVQQPQT